MKRRKKTWVYLMTDRRTGFVKIGYSRDPVYREKTLQAEMPLIDLLFAWRGTQEDETSLHKYFQNKRLRGEWFSIDQDDINVIHSYFYQAERYGLGISQAQIDVEKLAEEERWRNYEDLLSKSSNWDAQDIGVNAANLDFLIEGFGIEL